MGGMPKWGAVDLYNMKNKAILKYRKSYFFLHALCPENTDFCHQVR